MSTLFLKCPDYKPFCTEQNAHRASNGTIFFVHRAVVIANLVLCQKQHQFHLCQSHKLMDQVASDIFSEQRLCLFCVAFTTLKILSSLSANLHDG